MEEKKQNKKVGRFILMAIGFVVSGIGGAAMFGSLPGDIKTVKRLSKDDPEETTETEKTE